MAAWDDFEFHFRKTSQSELRDIAKLTRQKEWQSLTNYYRTIAFHFHKKILEDENVAAGRRLLSFVIALENWPLNKRKIYEANKVLKKRKQFEEKPFSDGLKETGEEFI